MRFILSPTALEELERLPRKDQERIASKMRFYAEQNDPLVFAKRLAAQQAYRFRIGDYRVIFEVQNKSLFVLSVLPRDKAYRDL